MKWLIFIIIFGVGCSGIKQKSPAPKTQGEIHFDVKEKTLDNGLKILVVENKKLPVFTYYTYFEVGSKYEEPGTTGSSHLLEHMMFKGAKKYKEGEFDKLVEGNGGRNNAYTSNDLTVYYESLPKEHLETVIDLEADRMQHLQLDPKSLDDERKVVLSERKSRYETRDQGKIYLTMMKELFKGTPYGSSVIGEINDLKTVSRQKVLDYFNTYYQPNNAVIVVVGDVEAKQVFSMIEDRLGDVETNSDLPKIKADHLKKLGGFEFKTKLPKRVYLKGITPYPMYQIAFKGIKVGGRDAFILDILSSVLGDGESSYLYQNLVLNKKPKMAMVYAANYTMQESGVFFIGGQLLPTTNLKQLEREMKKLLNRSCDKALSKRALQKVKNQYLFGMVSSLDTNAGIAEFIGQRQVYYGDYNFYKKEMDIYNSITLDELKSACQKYIKDQPALELSIWKNH